MRSRWEIVVPVKPAALGKSRLGAGADAARAIALDTVRATAAAGLVARVVVVSADRALVAALADDRGVEVLLEPEPRGLAAAVELGAAALDPEAPRGVLLGDLPALHPGDLDTALRHAVIRDRGFVRDAAGTGTTLVTAAPGVPLVARFGVDSATRHADAGLVELDLPAASTLRHDVDTPADLAAVRRFGLGPATRAVLEAPGAVAPGT